MEIVLSVLAFLTTLTGVAGFYVDGVVRDLIRSQLTTADRLEVRLEAIPNFKLAWGDVDRLRVAGRGLTAKSADLRIARLDLETDGISVDLDSLGKVPKLRRPLQAAVNVELSEADFNRALNSPDILKTLASIRVELPGSIGGSGQPEVATFTQPRITLVGNNQVILQSVVKIENRTETLLVSFRAGLAVDEGVRLRLVNPVFTLNEVPVPPELADVFLGGLNQIVDLDQLATQGIIARILKFEVVPGEMHLVGFARVEKIPGAP
ncbi:LmeA family phospholipid-binding protein [Gloeobacter violaceus]|uniref:Gll2973 protein n=1 Tax=Gloeobacter violaceus (strain ATCC 29082 / PCC 7421) TaxID=251221 RepID=Q7NCK5_GLOVI|nr:DUF2993 domain-containing protein [Gloeobacter violaceus]BAC90914.1 gll2973 [Gloeobacter violaceus PCC 7421]